MSSPFAGMQTIMEQCSGTRVFFSDAALHGFQLSVMQTQFMSSVGIKWEFLTFCCLSHHYERLENMAQSNLNPLGPSARDVVEGPIAESQCNFLAVLSVPQMG